MLILAIDIQDVKTQEDFDRAIKTIFVGRQLSNIAKALLKQRGIEY